MLPHYTPSLSPEFYHTEMSRYTRQDHFVAPSVHTKCILVVGLGGLASGLLPPLVGAGVGKLILCDADTVEEHNLHRQTIHTQAYVGKSKAESASAFVKGLNSDVTVKMHHVKVTYTNIEELLHGVDLVVDCTDNLPSRYMLNDACILSSTPIVFGAAIRIGGSSFSCTQPVSHACYRCVHPFTPLASHETCDNQGVFGPVPLMVGNLQAVQSLHFLSGQLGLDQRYTTLDVSPISTQPTQSFKIRKNPKCLVCSSTPTITSLALSQASQSCEHDLTWEALAEFPEDFVLVDVRAQSEESRVFGDVQVVRVALSQLQEVLLPSCTRVYVCNTGVDSLKALSLIPGGFHVVGGWESLGRG